MGASCGPRQWRGPMNRNQKLRMLCKLRQSIRHKLPGLRNSWCMFRAAWTDTCGAFRLNQIQQITISPATPHLQPHGLQCREGAPLQALHSMGGQEHAPTEGEGRGFGHLTESDVTEQQPHDQLTAKLTNWQGVNRLVAACGAPRPQRGERRPGCQARPCARQPPSCNWLVCRSPRPFPPQPAPRASPHPLQQRLT